MILRKFQQSPGTYPRHPKVQIWKDSLHKQVVKGPGYVSGICWIFLRMMIKHDENIKHVNLTVNLLILLFLWWQISSLSDEFGMIMVPLEAPRGLRLSQFMLHIEHAKHTICFHHKCSGTVKCVCAYPEPARNIPTMAWKHRRHQQCQRERNLVFLSSRSLTCCCHQSHKNESRMWKNKRQSKKT